MEPVRTLIIDESGNLGIKGRYFVIACIDTRETKSLHNVMKKAIKKAKEKFPEIDNHANELKANEAYPCVKEYVLRKITTKEADIHYIVADLKHVYKGLLSDKNCFYNYMLKILIDKIIKYDYRNKSLHILCDNKTVKVGSINSFTEYIKIHLNYERRLNLDVKVEYRDSNSKDAYVIQAADFIANSIYSLFEYKNDTSKMFRWTIAKKLKTEERFPYQKFGK
jgi:hypothetical protein